MNIQDEIADFRRYWRRRRPGSSTAIHYSSDVHIFFSWADERGANVIGVHEVDRFIEWQQSLGRATATIRRRLLALHLFYDYPTSAQDGEVPTTVVPPRPYLPWYRRLPRHCPQAVIRNLLSSL